MTWNGKYQAWVRSWTALCVGSNSPASLLQRIGTSAMRMTRRTVGSKPVITPRICGGIALMKLSHGNFDVREPIFCVMDVSNFLV